MLDIKEIVVTEVKLLTTQTTFSPCFGTPSRIYPCSSTSTPPLF